MKTKTLWVMALFIAGLGTVVATPGCKKESPEVSAAERAAIEKRAADKALADKAAADKAAERAKADEASAKKAAADKAVADLLASQKAAADKAAADKAAADRAAADKAAADKAAFDKAQADLSAAEKTAAAKAVAEKEAADKAAAAKAAEKAKQETAALPPDLVLMKADIARAVTQIDFTMAKLEVLSVATGDLDKPSQDSLDAMKTLETETQDLKKRATDMRDRGAAYFEAWEKQLAAMSTPEVMALAAKRKDELSAKYAEVLSAMQETRSAFDTYWADMLTIRKAVESGLTPDSQKVLGTQVKAAKEKASTVKTRIEGVSSKLNQVGVIYSNP